MEAFEKIIKRISLNTGISVEELNESSSIDEFGVTTIKNDKLMIHNLPYFLKFKDMEKGFLVKVYLKYTDIDFYHQTKYFSNEEEAYFVDEMEDEDVNFIEFNLITFYKHKRKGKHLNKDIFIDNMYNELNDYYKHAVNYQNIDIDVDDLPF